MTARSYRLPALRVLAVAVLATQLGGCALPSFLSFKGTKVRWDQVSLSAAENANRNSAVAVDIVLVTEDAVVEKVIDLPASKWFAARADLAKTFPKVLTYRSWELVPGQVLTVDGDSFGSPRVAAALVFADYATPGSHRVRIDEFKGRLVVRLEQDDLTVTTAP